MKRVSLESIKVRTRAYSLQANVLYLFEISCYSAPKLPNLHQLILSWCFPNLATCVGAQRWLNQENRYLILTQERDCSRHICHRCYERNYIGGKGVGEIPHLVPRGAPTASLQGRGLLRRWQSSGPTLNHCSCFQECSLAYVFFGDIGWIDILRYRRGDLVEGRSG